MKITIKELNKYGIKIKYPTRFLVVKESGFSLKDLEAVVGMRHNNLVIVRKNFRGDLYEKVIPFSQIKFTKKVPKMFVDKTAIEIELKNGKIRLEYPISGEVNICLFDKLQLSIPNIKTISQKEYFMKKYAKYALKITSGVIGGIGGVVGAEIISDSLFDYAKDQIGVSEILSKIGNIEEEIGNIQTKMDSVDSLVDDTKSTIAEIKNNKLIKYFS